MGGTYCIVRGCYNSRGKKVISMFSFPNDPTRAKHWLSKCQREDLFDKIGRSLKNYQICAAHFEDCMFTSREKKRLLCAAIPTIFPSLEGCSSEKQLIFGNKDNKNVYDFNTPTILEPEGIVNQAGQSLNSVGFPKTTLTSPSIETQMLPAHSTRKKVRGNLLRRLLQEKRCNQQEYRNYFVVLDDFHKLSDRMVTCWALGCNHNNLRERCRFFTFPKDKVKCEKWITLLKCTCFEWTLLSKKFGDCKAKWHFFSRNLPPRNPTTRKRVNWKVYFNVLDFFLFHWINIYRKGKPGIGARVCSCHFPNGEKEYDPLINAHIMNTNGHIKDSSIEVLPILPLLNSTPSCSNGIYSKETMTKEIPVVLGTENDLLGNKLEMTSFISEHSSYERADYSAEQISSNSNGEGPNNEIFNRLFNLINEYENHEISNLPETRNGKHKLQCMSCGESKFESVRERDNSITLCDVLNYLDKNYYEQDRPFLKSQLILLHKTSKQISQPLNYLYNNNTFLDTNIDSSQSVEHIVILNNATDHDTLTSVCIENMKTKADEVVDIEFDQSAKDPLNIQDEVIFESETGTSSLTKENLNIDSVSCPFLLILDPIAEKSS